MDLSQENTNNTNNTANSPLVTMHKTYAKDISLETNYIELHHDDKDRSYNIDYSFTADKKGDFLEVDFGARICIKKSNKIICILEIIQTALFTIQNDPRLIEDLYVKIVSIYCPTIIFPYLKQNLENILHRTSLTITNFTIEPIDFVAASKNANIQKSTEVPTEI